MRFERRYIPMMLLVMGVGLFAGVMIMAGHSPAVGRVVPVLSEAPPGGELVTPEPVPLPVFEGEMTVIEPIQTAAPKLTEADLRTYERAIWQEVNKRRIENGRQALVLDERISNVARKHSEDMAIRGYFSHVSPEGVDPWQRLQMAGLPAGSENIREGFGNAQQDVDSWMVSPKGHRKNILDASVSRTGVGIALGPEWPIITQNFLP